MFTDRRSVAGSRPISSHRDAITGRAVDHLLGREPVEVQLVREAGGEAPGPVRAVAADEDRDPRLLDAARDVDRVAHGRLRPRVRRRARRRASASRSRASPRAAPSARAAAGSPSRRRRTRPPSSRRRGPAPRGRRTRRRASRSSSRRAPGCGSPLHRTRWPRRTRAVSAASADRPTNASNVISSVGTGSVWTWSNSQIESKPSASASCATATVRAHARAGSQPSYSPVQPWGTMIPTRTVTPPSRQGTGQQLYGWARRVRRRRTSCSWSTSASRR